MSQVALLDEAVDFLQREYRLLSTEMAQFSEGGEYFLFERRQISKRQPIADEIAKLCADQLVHSELDAATSTTTDSVKSVKNVDQGDFIRWFALARLAIQELIVQRRETLSLPATQRAKSLIIDRNRYQTEVMELCNFHERLVRCGCPYDPGFATDLRHQIDAFQYTEQE